MEYLFGGVNKEENALVDFDRMWADKQDGAERKYDTETDDGDSEADAKGDEEMVEYEDEFGRLRTTKLKQLAEEETTPLNWIIQGAEMEPDDTLVVITVCQGCGKGKLASCNGFVGMYS